MSIKSQHREQAQWYAISNYVNPKLVKQSQQEIIYNHNHNLQPHERSRS
jgi:hypothetical protein